MTTAPAQQFNKWASLGASDEELEEPEAKGCKEPDPEIQVQGQVASLQKFMEEAGGPDGEEDRLRMENAQLQKLTRDLTECLKLATGEKDKTLKETKQLQEWIIGFFADGDLEQVCYTMPTTHLTLSYISRFYRRKNCRSGVTPQPRRVMASALSKRN